MKRRALLSGIVPAVAGAAGACRSSVADVLTGINTKDAIVASGAMVSRESACLMIVKQWLHTFMKNDELVIPFCREPKESSSEYEQEDVISIRLDLDTSDDFNAIKFNTFNSVCDDAFDNALESFIRSAVVKVLDEKLSAMPIVKVSGVGDVSRVLKCPLYDTRQFMSDVSDVPGVEYRRYWASEESSPVVRVWVEPNYFWMSDESNNSKLGLDVHVKFCASKNLSQMCYVEGMYKNYLSGRLVPYIRPVHPVDT